MQNATLEPTLGDFVGTGGNPAIDRLVDRLRGKEQNQPNQRQPERRQKPALRIFTGEHRERAFA